MIKFTVHIPVYNVEKYLERCINSVLNQTYKNFDIILTDDGSTDSSGEICDCYAKKYENITVFHNENQGLLLTRRFSINKANSEYSLFVDSDDYIEADTFEKIAAIIEENNCDLVVFHYQRVSEFSIRKMTPVWNKSMVFDGNGTKEFFEKFLLSGNLNNLCMKAVKTSLIQGDNRNYFDYSWITNAEDLLQSYHIVFNANKIVYTPEVFYNYWHNNESIVHTTNLNRYKSMLGVLYEGFEYIEKNKLGTNEFLEKYANRVVDDMLFCIIEIALSDVDKSLKTNILDDIYNYEICRNFVLKKANVCLMRRNKKTIYSLFAACEFDKLVIYIRRHIKLMRFLSKIKRSLLTLIGKGSY